MMRLCALLTIGLLSALARGETVRFATFNSSLSRESPGELLDAMRDGGDAKAKAVAAVIQAARPDVLLLQEFDHGPGYDEDGEALQLFQQNYLMVPQQQNLESIEYEHVYLVPSNTGVPTGVDLNGDGLIAPTKGAEVGTDAYAADAHGWGKFPGQYAFVILSKYPIDRENVRTFGDLLWRDMVGDHMPTDYYDEAARDVLRLSSKNHADVPIRVGGGTVNVVAAHPTPPVFDGLEDRNGRRNHSEITLLRWIIETADPDDADYPPPTDDAGRSDRLPRPFVVMGDLNADRWDGERYDPAPVEFSADGERRLEPGPATRPQTFVPLPEVERPDEQRPDSVVVDAPHAVERLLRSTAIISNFAVAGPGGTAAAREQGGVNLTHRGKPQADTADWNDADPGNLRVDYVLPSADLKVVDGGVLWPAPDQPLMGVDLATVEAASDHRLVWVDVEIE